MFLKIVFIVCCPKLLKMPKKGSKNGHFWGPKIPENHENSPSENVHRFTIYLRKTPKIGVFDPPPGGGVLIPPPVSVFDPLRTPFSLFLCMFNVIAS